jgi:hypothetical protein
LKFAEIPHNGMVVRDLRQRVCFSHADRNYYVESSLLRLLRSIRGAALSVFRPANRRQVDCVDREQEYILFDASS